MAHSLFTPSRREFLLTSSLLGSASAFAQPVDGSANPLPNRGWHPERLSTSVLSQAQSAFSNVANHAYNQQLTSNDMLSAAHHVWSVHSHLHEVGFHRTAFAHIHTHVHALAYPSPELLRAQYEQLQQKTGIQVPFDTVWYWHTQHITDTSIRGMDQSARQDKNSIALIGRRGARALGYFARQLPASAASYHRLHEYEQLGKVVHPTEPRARLRRVHFMQDCFNGDSSCYDPSYTVYLDGNDGYGGGWEEPVYPSPTMSSQGCWWLEVAGLYFMIMSIPLAAVPPAAVTLLAGGIAIAVAGLLFNC